MSDETLAALLEATRALLGVRSFRATIFFGPNAERLDVDVIVPFGSESACSVLPSNRPPLSKRIRNESLPN